MTNSKFLRALPILTLLVICIILGGMIVREKRAEEVSLPALTETEETSKKETEQADKKVEETESEETEAPETEPPETESPVVDISSKGLEFKSLGDGTCYVSGMGSCNDSFVILPDTSPYGERVIGIGDYAFRNNGVIKCIELNEGLEFVGAYAFYGTEIENVFIPKDLVQIGDFAFTNCKRLKNISVDNGNTVFTDMGGVLYSKDLSTLICYPGGKDGNSISIGDKVLEIKTMAFYNCDRIKIINYNGSVSSFKRIRIGAGNESFEEAVVTFVEGDAKDGIFEK